MDTSKIVSLKQEQITLDTKIQELSKKLKSKQIYLIVAFVSLLLTFIIFATGASGEGSDILPIFFFLFAFLTILFFVLAFIGKRGSKIKLTQSKSRLQQIKMDLVQLEHQ